MEENRIKMNDNENLFRPLNYLLGKSFSVKDYQRGYKWDTKEILELLNDINEHDANRGKYCLQPIIVRMNEINDEKRIIELIDGQQRITSIYLILIFLENTQEGIFDISFETREESREFLSTKIIALGEYAKNKISWENFIQKEEFEKYDNVDVYHFYTVFNAIYQWFEDKKEVNFKDDFLNKLLNLVYIIWYDIDKSAINSQIKVSAENIFLNLNAGKILLTSSELIKALFILECQNKNTKEIAKLKSSELALEWDQIENKLQDNSFWFFICDNEKYNTSSTRIDFLLDIVNKRDVKKSDDLFSYRIYEKRFKENVDLDWMSVKNTFNKLSEWYDDKESYHYVGFLIVSGIKKITQIIEKSQGVSKSDFKNSLIGWIKTEFKKLKKDELGLPYNIYNIEKLDYEESRKECEKVLVLLNILYYIKNLSDNKFPFELYKTEKWSVEHINPQNPRDFENIGVIKRWLISNKFYYEKTKPINESIIKQLVLVLGFLKNINIDDKRRLSDLKLDKAELMKFDNLVDAIRLDLDLHGISNLTLLDKNTNSKLSNKPYLDKRELILKLDQDGKYMSSEGLEKKVFIPVCTKNVFSKIYTTDKDSVVDSFFGKNDMESYSSFIQNQLNFFHL